MQIQSCHDGSKVPVGLAFSFRMEGKCQALEQADQNFDRFTKLDLKISLLSEVHVPLTSPSSPSSLHSLHSRRSPPTKQERMSLTLYAIGASIILDGDGNRVLPRHYRQENNPSLKGLANTQ